MQLIFLSKTRGQLAQVRLGSRRAIATVAVAALLLAGSLVYGGYYSAGVFGVNIPRAEMEAWQAELAEQEAQLEATRNALQQNVDALALRLGQMNAHVVRLDALGSRLTQMADLNDGEFDFSSSPSLGGPEEPLSITQATHFNGVVSDLNTIEQRLTDRSQQLEVLEEFLLDRKLRDEVLPEGRPVRSGYISSRFGSRTDPFTGRMASHKGIDFAGRAGAEVIAVGSGVVTWSGLRYGYGELVEVNHGNGYVTRYAHNSNNLVAVGDTVKRGQIIAEMGSTGRATGPNLHFEVLRNGRQVDPLTFIN